MNSVRFLAAGVILLAAAHPTEAQAKKKHTPAPSAANAKIAKLDVKAPKEIDPKAVLSKCGLKVGDAYSKTALDDAKTKVAAGVAYETHYYLEDDSVRVTQTTQGKAVNVLIEVNVPMIKQIIFSGSGPISPDELLKKMVVHVGEPLNLKALENDLAELESAYSNDGYQADVKGDAPFKDGILTIPVQVAKIRNFTFIGLRRHSEQEVFGRMRSKPGEYFNSKWIRADMNNIKGLFREIEPIYKFPSPGVVDVKVTVAD